MVALVVPAAQTSLHGMAGFGRRYRSSDAIKNQKLNKKAAKLFKRQRRRDDDGERARWELEACERLERIYARRKITRHPLFATYAYWQIRRCGWDVVREDFRVVWWGKQELVVPPQACPLWTWWLGIGWRQRDQITGEKRQRVSVQATVSIHNPAFQVEEKKTYTVDD